MTKQFQVYKCKVCGIVAEVLDGGAGELVCCGEPMVGFEEKTADKSTEKHVPYIEKTADGILVKVGQNQNHPMEEKHYIQWIELLVDGKSYRQFLNPGDAPQAIFPVVGEKVAAREFCNIHGLWKGA
jgi:superoxide reductase